MKGFGVIFILLLGLSAVGGAELKGSPIPVEKGFQEHFQALSSTNNVSIFLEKIKKQMPSTFYVYLKQQIQKSPQKMFYFRKTGPRSFSMKLSNGGWGQFKLDPKMGLFLGQTNYPWDRQKTYDKNISAIQAILKKEFPKKTSFFSLFPRAYADEISRYEILSLQLGELSRRFRDLEDAVFLGQIHDLCADLPQGAGVHSFNFNNPDNHNIITDRPRNNTDDFQRRTAIRDRFVSLQSLEAEQRSGLIRIFSFLGSGQSPQASFEAVSSCLVENGVITEIELQRVQRNLQPPAVSQ
jgi:hypothetical protein